MNVRDLTDENAEDWQKFCTTAEDAWFWHRTDWLTYQEHRLESPRSLSFLVTVGGEPLAICPLLLVKSDGVREFSFGGAYGTAPAFADDLRGVNQKTIRRHVFDEIDERAQEHDVQRVRLYYPPLTGVPHEEGLRVNPLLKYGYVDETIPTRLIDVNRPADELKNEFRDTYVHEIENAPESVEVTIYDEQNITESVFTRYKELHHKAAGEVTRPPVTFEMMYEWITDGDGFLAGARLDGEFVGFSYFFTFKDNVYYGSAANDPDVSGHSLGHLTQWRAIEWMHEHGYECYNIGRQRYEPTLSEPASKKEVNISFFKRGFGGYDVPHFRGTKYYDAELFREEYTNRVEAYAEHVKSRG
jgi:hypothetical protein